MTRYEFRDPTDTLLMKFALPHKPRRDGSPPYATRQQTKPRFPLRRRATLPILLAVGWLAVSAPQARAVTLYDASLGTLPGEQDWYYAFEPTTGVSASQSLEPGYTLLDTTPLISDRAGYFSLGHSGVPLMIRQDGYRVRFDAQVLSESHTSADRAGFSVIVLSDDSVGVELAFWEDEIWAQTDTPLFTHGEGVLFDTTAAITQYDLFIVDDRFALWADGAPILSGPLRDYTAHEHFVYSAEEFLFFGDDTMQASAEVAIATIEAEADIKAPLVLGDMNSDQQVTAEDVSAFVLALTDAESYFAHYPTVDAAAFGDVNQDGAFDLGDVKPFAALVASSSAAPPETPVPVPEPAGGLSLLAALVGYAATGRRFRQARDATANVRARTNVEGSGAPFNRRDSAALEMP